MRRAAPIRYFELVLEGTQAAAAAIVNGGAALVTVPDAARLAV